jgi:hypothetical protein
LLKVGQGDQTTWEVVEGDDPHQIARWGGERVLAKTGFYKEVHKWTQGKLPESNLKLIKQRTFAIPQFFLL